MVMLKQINKYWHEQSAHFGALDNFKKSGIYSFYEKAFGQLIYTEDNSKKFVGIDQAGNFYDEVYYPQEIAERAGSLVPKILLESNVDNSNPDLVWKDVAQKGYGVLRNIQFDTSLVNQALDEAFIPYGINPELNMSKTVQHAFFATQADYDNPERHKSPDYMNAITSQCLRQMPTGNFHVNSPLFHTADIVKYLFDPNEVASTHGPYTFHMDFFSRLHYMFFIYFSKKTPIVGRELLVGKRKGFDSFGPNSLDPDFCKNNDLTYAFEKITDDQMLQYDSIEIDHSMVVLMNTLNPIMMHKVNKLRNENEVILMTNYCWSKKLE